MIFRLKLSFSSFHISCQLSFSVKLDLVDYNLLYSLAFFFFIFDFGEET